MPEGDIPKPPDKSRRAVILATVGIVVIMGLAVFYVAVVGPMRQVHTTLDDLSEDRISRGAAIERLGGPERAAHRLVTYLRLPRWTRTTRSYATRVLGYIGPVTDEVLPALIKALGDTDVSMRSYAALGLARIGPEAKAAVPALVTALGDSERRVGVCTAMALGAIGPAAMPALLEAIGDRKWEVRRRAALALGWIGPEAEPAVPALEKLSTDAHSGVRETAAKAIKKIRAKPSPPPD